MLPFLNAIFVVVLWFAMSANIASAAGSMPIDSQIQSAASEIQPQVVAWRRDIHQHPELGFQEVRTAALVAAYLKSLNFDQVKTEVGTTGVVGILHGATPGPVVALRADMDALSVKEQTGLPFASEVVAQWQGETVPVMHACGHDAHVAMLLGVANVLAGLKDKLPGSVMFIFQPAEEGSDHGGGAEAMIADGLYDEIKPDAIFGLHVGPYESGTIHYRSGPTAASSDTFEVVFEGEGTHGAMPWGGTDSLSAAAQMVLSLQAIVSRMVDITRTPAMVSVGSFHSGTRHNVVPPSAALSGTIRTFDPQVQGLIHRKISEIAGGAANIYGVTEKVTIEKGHPVLVNDPQLGEMMRPTLLRLAGDNLREASRGTGSEDFGFFTDGVPGMYMGLGALPPGVKVYNHSPNFTIDEDAMEVSVRLLSQLSYDFLSASWPQ